MRQACNLLTVLFALAGTLSLSTFADAVSPTQARAVAQAWLVGNKAFSGRVADDADVHAQKDAGGRVLWYEVATEEGGRVITSSDTSLEPVIACVERWPGELTEDNPLYVMLKSDLENRLDVIAPQTNGNLRLMTSSVSNSQLQESMRKAQSKWSRLSPGSRLKLSAAASTAVTPSVIVSWIPEWRLKRLTHWDQNGSGLQEHCYDYYTANHYPCGCVATAGAALLQYFNLTKAPDVTHRCRVDGTSVYLTTKGIDYDWSLAPRVWADSQSPTDEQAELFGRATYDMGVCLGMSYNAGGSSASVVSIASVLKERFGLAHAESVPRLQESQVFPCIYAQIRAGEPVALGISRSGGGHAVVAVGYAEDNESTPYTRIFMGWGGSSDAWYALPAISRYTAISDVVTAMGMDEAVAAICGRVKTDAGEPLAFADVSYDGSKKFVTDANGFWAGRVVQDGKSHVLSCAGVSKPIDIGSSLADIPTEAIDFTVPTTALPLVYEDAETACERALASGRMVFLLNGATWCGYCTKLKGWMSDLGQSFEDRYTYLWHDRDINTYGLATCSTPTWGCFDSRNFDIANKFESHASRLYYLSGCPSSSSSFNSCLASADAKWAKLNSEPVSIDLGSSDVISGVTELTAKATFADGVTSFVTRDVKWKIVAGSAATMNGRMLNPNPGATGSVLLLGELAVMGERHAFFHKVNITSGVALTGIAIEGPNTLDLYDNGSAVFTARATYSDGTKGVFDATWSLDPSAPASALISESGVLSFSTYRIMESSFQVVVKATCGGFSDSRLVTVVPPGTIQKISGVFDKNAFWPNAHLTFTPTCVQWKRHDTIEAATTSLDGISVGWDVYDGSYFEEELTGGTELTLPSSMSSSAWLYGSFTPTSGRYAGYCASLGTSDGVNVYSSEPTWVTVTFDTGGLQSMPSAKYPVGGKYILLPGIAKTGYTTSWHTDDGTEVDTYNSMVPSSSHTLHAKLTPSRFYVCFNANDGSGDTLSKWFYWDTESAFPSRPFSRAGYSFEGWATSKDGEVVYADATRVYNWHAVYKSIQLYAVWRELVPVGASIGGPDAVLGSSAQLNAFVCFGEGADMPLADDVAWRVTSGSAATVTSEGVVSPVSGKSGRVTIEASFAFRGKPFQARKDIRIIDEKDVSACWIDGKGIWMPKAVKESVQYSLVVMDGEGGEYVVVADSWDATWLPASSSVSSDFSKSFTLSDAGLLSCVSSGNQGTVTLTANVGSLSANRTIRTYRCARIDKWIPRPASSVLYPGAQVPMDDEFVVRLANGDEIERLSYSELDVFSVYFSNSTDEELFDVSDKPTLVNGILSVPAGASCLPDDGLVHFQTSARSLNSGQYYYQYYYDYLNDGTFPFAWYDVKPTLIDVTFDANGGMVDECATITRSYAASKTYKVFPKPVRIGHVFDGWYTASFGGVKVTVDSMSPANAHTLFARWNTGSFWICLSPNGGSGNSKWVSVGTSEFATGRLPANTFTRAGYVFDGWSLTTTPSYSEGNYFADCAALSSLPAKSGYTYLYAIWREVGDFIPVSQRHISVPRSWLDRHASLLSANGNDYVKMLKGNAANGRTVYECYVAGLDPEDPEDEFSLDLTFENGVPVLDFDVKARRAYTIWGSDDLSTWSKVSSLAEGGYNFFKVSVEMP